MRDIIENRTVLRLGVQEVDEQHDALADVLNRLARHVREPVSLFVPRKTLPERLSFKDCRGANGGGPCDESTFEVTKTVLDELTHLTETHFADEESLMAQAGYPGLADHRLEHQLLLAELMEFVRDVQAGYASLEICHLLALKDWFVGHVVLADREFADFLQASGAAVRAP